MPHKQFGHLIGHLCSNDKEIERMAHTHGKKDCPIQCPLAIANMPNGKPNTEKAINSNGQKCCNNHVTAKDWHSLKKINILKRLFLWIRLVG
jgi:hypothetical protein